MSRYVSTFKHENKNYSVAIGHDVNGKYFFDVFDERDKCVDGGSLMANLTLQGVEKKCQQYGIKCPKIDTENFRLMKAFDAATGEIRHK